MTGKGSGKATTSKRSPRRTGGAPTTGRRGQDRGQDRGGQGRGAQGTTSSRRGANGPEAPEAQASSHGVVLTEEQVEKPRAALGVYYPALDGLRAVAMAVMLAYHGELQWAKGAFVGLSQFFTLSGFLIVSILLRRREHGGSLSLVDFWSQRYRRLMPAAMVTLVGVVIFGATVADPVQVEEIPAQVAAAVGQVANWFFIYTEQSYVRLFSAPSPVQHFWSLSVEEQFYIVMPIVFWLMIRYTKTLRPIAAFFGLGAIASTVWMIWLYDHGASLDRLYYGTDTRAAELLMGGLLAVVLHRYPLRLGLLGKRVLAVVGLVAFGLTIWGWTHLELADGPVWRGGFLVISIVSCALILSLINGGPLAWVLSWGFLPAMGRIIYGLYLFHWPLFLWLTPERTGMDGWSLFTLRMVVTFALAIASYNLIEMPIRRGLPSWPKGALRWAVAPTVAVLVVALAFIAGSREITAIQGADLTQEDANALLAPVSASPPPVVPGRPKVLVVGDSMARSMGLGLERWAEETGAATVWNAGVLGCGLLDEGEVGEAIGRRTAVFGTGVCEGIREQWASQIAAFDPDLVIVLSTVWDLQDRKLPEWRDVLLPGDDAFDEYQLREYREVVDILGAQGATVLWVKGPCSRALTVNGVSLETEGLFEIERVRNLNEQVIPQLMADRPEVRTFDMFSILCPDGTYQEDVGAGHDVRPDGVHFSVAGSRWFADHFGDAMIAAGLPEEPADVPTPSTTPSGGSGEGGS